MVLGKRRRGDDDEPVNTGCKRRKILNTHLSSSSCEVYNFNLFMTTYNPAPKPSLLRLPAELREQIWQYAYGHSTIHVDITTMNKPAAASHKYLTYTIQHDPICLLDPNPVLLPPPICKQFHAEATSAFYSSSTFSFNAPQTFRAFALSPHACVPRLQHLEIPQLTQRHWDTALNASLVGRLTSLRGVVLMHEHWRHVQIPIPPATAVIWKPIWRMISAFQQHKLEKNATRFKLVVLEMYKQQRNSRGWPIGAWAGRPVLKAGDDQWEEAQSLQDGFTRALLEYTPRRVSRRGGRGRGK